ncbi:hypothetical protein [Rubripirellula tenax]|nr:hypothetical protein [Rubripirellula tenax]
MNRSRGIVVSDNGKSIAATRLSRPLSDWVNEIVGLIVDNSIFIEEARRSLYGFLDCMLLRTIDYDVFLSRDADVEAVDVGYDVSTYGKKKPVHERLMFTDAVNLQEIMDHPNGDSHKTYQSGRGMAATTHGDAILSEAEDWCDAWWQDYTSNTLQDLDDLWEIFGEAGLTTPLDWYADLDGTLGDLRARCTD